MAACHRDAPDLAPQHVAQIKKLAREGKYDGVVFHRVIEGFRPRRRSDRNRLGRHGRDAEAEFSKEPHVRGSVSMARTATQQRAQPSSSRVQDSNFLDGQYTCGAGHVGHGFVDKIKRGQGQSGRCAAADKMIKVQVAADARTSVQNTTFPPPHTGEDQVGKAPKMILPKEIIPI